MTQNNSATKNRIVVIAGLGVALLIAMLLSPLASKDPDGLDRVSQDLKFEQKATENPPAKQLPFHQIFDDYALRGVADEKVATVVAGVIGTLCTFGLSWGLGKLAVRGKNPASETNTSDRTLE